MLRKTILILFLFAEIIFSQNLDSLYKEFILRNSIPNIETQFQISESENNKCGFSLAASIRTHLNEFTSDQLQKIEEIFARPEMQKSIVSPSGIFRIHFDTTGVNKPEYDTLDILNNVRIKLDINESVRRLAIAFDSAYTYEVEILGYIAPPKDGTFGGDDKYDIYVTSSAGGYGSTNLDDEIGDNKYISYIKIHNTFTGSFYTKGIEAARVTAAHEFHHAIQVGNYIYRDSDRFYYELTSTSMEEFVFDHVNDYYYYMKSYFNKPSRRFTRFDDGNDGYDVALWNIFLKEKFGSETPNTGDEIIKKSWDLMSEKNQKAIVALQNSLSHFGFSFSDLFNEFGIWLYFTNNRTKENKYFEEASFYPLVKNSTEIFLESSKMPIMLSCEPTSLNYLLIKDNSQGLPDSIFAILSNSDVNGTLTTGNNIDIDFTIETSSFDGSFEIGDNYFAKIVGNNSNYIGHSYIINNELASNYIERTNVDFVYPQPFRYEEFGNICFPTFADESGKSELYIYSADMNLIYNNSLPISVSGKMIVTWNGLDNNMNKLASGVYIYVTKANDKIKKGKFVILK
ncbi:MAG: MXAN_6640 family putative metalloprotease [Melioribacteraceae bacterium]